MMRWTFFQILACEENATTTITTTTTTIYMHVINTRSSISPRGLLRTKKHVLVLANSKTREQPVFPIKQQSTETYYLIFI